MGNEDAKEEIADLLRKCSRAKDIRNGIRIHGEIRKLGLLREMPSLGTALLNMYAKCGMLAQAHQMHDDLFSRCVSSWNILIEGYLQKGSDHEALNCYEQMQAEGLTPNVFTFVDIFRACGNMGSMRKGMSIHSQIVRNGFFLKNQKKKKNVAMLGNTLVYMYAKCGMFAEARKVLVKEIPVPNVVSWSSLIDGYSQHSKYQEAFECFEEMKSKGIAPDEVTFTCLLKACRSIEMGEQLYKEVSDRGFLEKNDVLATALVDMYGKCGSLARAHGVHDGIHVRDVVSWSALIAGYVQQGQDDEAMSCWKQMLSECIIPNSVTLLCALKACGSRMALGKGKQIHGEVLNRGMLDEDGIAVGNALVDMYAKCGKPAKAQEVFEELRVQDAVSWSSLIGGYVQSREPYEALHCFERMQSEGIPPDELTFVHILKACGITRAVDEGEQIHRSIAKRGLNLEKDDVVLGTALVDMYAGCGMLAKAQQVHDELYGHSVVSWNALISGYADHGSGEDALACFKLMRIEGLSPDPITFLCILKACGSTRTLVRGKQIHEEIISRGLLEKDVALATCLLDMYAKCGALPEAEYIHYGLLGSGDAVSWLPLISGYVQQGEHRKALNCFEQMQAEELSPGASILTCALKACASVGAVEKGMRIHAELRSKGFLEKDIVLGNALVDMYTRSDMLAKAREVLIRELPTRDVVSWNALIRGYAEFGRVQEAIDCLEEMDGEGLAPDLVTFVSILNACSRSGLPEAASACLGAMCGEYAVIPDSEHYACMVSALGRVGHFDRALFVIEMLPSPRRCLLPAWLALLAASRTWGNLRIGRLAFDEAMRLDNSCGAC